MSNHMLKWIAIITMTIDHIGVYLIPVSDPLHLYFRLIGRLAFPLFAFLIAEGFKHTKDVKRYMKRLLFFAAAIEIFTILFYLLFFNQPTWSGYTNQTFSFNIFWTLLLGLVALYLWHHEDLDMKLAILPLLLVGLYVQYTFYGILLILMFGSVKNFQYRLLGISLLTIIYVFYPVLLFNRSFNQVFYVQLFAIATMGLIYFYNGIRGKQMRYFFYLYYPLHLVVLYLIRYIFMT